MFLGLIVSLILTALFAWAAAFAARRILDFPVSWPRSIVVGILISFGGVPLSSLFLSNAGIFTSHEALNHLGVTLLLGGLSFAWTFALGVGLLVFAELLWPTGSIPDPISFFRALKASQARRRRYLQVSRTALRQGLLTRVGPRALTAGTPEAAKTATALVNTLNASGVTFIKLGQVLSTRADLLPPEYISSLSTLQSGAQTEDWQLLEPVFQESLGRPVEEVFASVNPLPLAAASVAQVHTAVLLTGQEVVIKIQRPKAGAQVGVDLDIITRFASMIEQRTSWGRSLGLAHLAEGFAASLRDELDYVLELENMRSIAASSSSLRIPRSYPEFSGKTVLVMERLVGEPLGTASLSALGTQTRQALAKTLLRGILEQILIHGVFHADLHPGNILLLSQQEPVELALLDFGSVGRLAKSTRSSLTGLLLAVGNDDNVAASRCLLEMLGVPPELDRPLFERELGEVLSYASGSTTMLMTKLFSLLQRHQLSLPPQLAAALRAIGALEGTLLVLDPSFKLVDRAKEFSGELLSQLLTPAAIRATAANNAMAIMTTVQQLPGNLASFNRKLESGNLRVQVRQFAAVQDRQFLRSIANESLLVIITVAALLGSVALLVAGTGPFIAPTLRLYTFLGYCLGLGAAVLGLRSLVRLLRGSSIKESQHW